MIWCYGSPSPVRHGKNAHITRSSLSGEMPDSLKSTLNFCQGYLDGSQTPVVIMRVENRVFVCLVTAAQRLEDGSATLSLIN